MFKVLHLHGVLYQLSSVLTYSLVLRFRYIFSFLFIRSISWKKVNITSSSYTSHYLPLPCLSSEWFLPIGYLAGRSLGPREGNSPFIFMIYFGPLKLPMACPAVYSFSSLEVKETFPSLPPLQSHQRVSSLDGKISSLLLLLLGRVGWEKDSLGLPPA